MSSKEIFYCDECKEPIDEATILSGAIVRFRDYAMDFHAGCLKEMTAMQFVQKLGIEFRTDWTLNTNINDVSLIKFLYQSPAAKNEEPA